MIILQNNIYIIFKKNVINIYLKNIIINIKKLVFKRYI